MNEDTIQEQRLNELDARTDDLQKELMRIYGRIEQLKRIVSKHITREIESV